MDDLTKEREELYSEAFAIQEDVQSRLKEKKR